MAVEIAELGNPVLQKLASKVAEVQAPAIKDILAQMTQAMQELGGVGIAAPQIGVSLQILIVASKPNARYPNAPLMKPVIMLNPEIMTQSTETERGWEGCLSVPGIRGHVARARRVDISFDNVDGKRQRLILEGFPARIFLHEYDHLIGLTFLDRIDSVRDLMSEKELAKR